MATDNTSIQVDGKKNMSDQWYGKHQKGKLLKTNEKTNCFKCVQWKTISTFFWTIYCSSWELSIWRLIQIQMVLQHCLQAIWTPINVLHSTGMFVFIHLLWNYLFYYYRWYFNVFFNRSLLGVELTVGVLRFKQLIGSYISRLHVRHVQRETIHNTSLFLIFDMYRVIQNLCDKLWVYVHTERASLGASLVA